MKKLLSVIIVIVTMFFINRPAMAASWNFAVFGDDRSDNSTGSAVNTTAVTAIATDIKNNRNASFAIVLGDLVHGQENDTPIADQFDTFKTAAASGGFKVAGEAGAGVPYYPVRGNHDNDGVDTSGVAWKAAFPSLPQNGPTTNTSGGGNSEKGMTYSFTNGNSLFLSLDEYINTDTYPNQVNQTWVNDQLSTFPSTHVFAYGHLPAYATVAGESLALKAAARDTFLTSLYDNNGQIYFAGHQHFSGLARVNIDGDVSKVFYPIIDGSGGAPGTLWDGTYTDPNVTGLYYNSTSSTPFCYTYSIITVDDDLVWLRLYGTASVSSPDWLDLYALVISGTLTTDTNTLKSGVANYSTIDFNQASDGTYSEVIAGTGNIIKSGAGTLTLSGANTYSGGTIITTGTLKTGHASALGTGAVTNNATLDVGTTNLALGTGNTYTQNAGSILKLTADSASSFGKITSDVAAVVDAGSTINVTVGYLPNNATLTIVDTGGTGIGAVPTTITSSSSFVTFSAADSGGNLILTANRSGSNSFSGAATNANGASVGAVLDNIADPSADMQIVLAALDNLTPSEVATSEDSMTPTVDGGVTQSSTQMLNQFINNIVSHLENTQAPGGDTGIATGEDYLKGVDIWAQGLGDYAHQDNRGSSNGYNATTWGLSGGADMPVFNDSNRIGLGSGYGQTFVRSKDFAGKTDIDSIPAIAYYSYEGTNYPVYFDAAFTFVYNSYNGSRQVSAGTAERTANADYNGQQYSGYFEGGYSFFYKNLRMTPLVSFQYMHLHTGSYTETGAGALNLSVSAQDYDMAQTGFGAKVAYPFRQKWGDLTPELHFKWLYDWVGDSQATTASFAGGGTSFGTQGFEPAQSGYDFGTKITFKFKCNISVGLDYDFLFKDDYYEHTGIVDVRYSF